jgi:class 3 adenylate cyclase/predicted ATPase
MPAKDRAKQTPPTGVVTLLFTDIAGSSRLWEEHGDRFIPVWQAHDAILRDAFSRFGGYEVKSEGDAFMVAFADAASALHCALFAQAALTRYPWPPDVPGPRVRMGLHTGEPFLHGNDYFGPIVNRAAHICKAAHGGQIILSEETKNEVGQRADPHIEFADLGELRLKDMGAPQQLYQVQHPGCEAHAFPPPRTLDGQPNNLPVQRTSFVGRAQEIEQVAAFLAQGEKPVLTLTGPGGIGKTRLSLQAAAARAEWFPDGVWYVRLMHAQDVVGAAIEIAEMMRIPLDPDESPLEQVRDYLANRLCLLILDDANNVPQVDKLIRELLSGSSNLRCLATSRESLQIDEADDMEISGLSLTSDIETTHVLDDTTEMIEVAPTEGALTQPFNILTDTDAGRLFLERASAVNPNFKLSRAEQAAAEELVARLQGVPISIERAAQLMDRVPPSVVLGWLDQRLEAVPLPSKKTGVEKFKTILRQNAQKVYHTIEETTRASTVHLGHLLQGIADVATDLKNTRQASELGRESLRLSQEAGDPVGIAAALHQLARVKWQQGDRQSAVAMLSVAVDLYRSYHTPEMPDLTRELERMREQLAQTEGTLPITPSVEGAVALALRESSTER